MKYDRDLSRIRIASWVMIAANVVVGGVNLRTPLRWYIAFTAGIWIGNFVMLLKQTAAQQKTRDLGRVIEAGMHVMGQHLSLWRRLSGEGEE